MGTVVTLQLPPGSPIADLPWVITIGPLGDDQEWKPVVCSPYERLHTLALAQAAVADEALLATVDPLPACPSGDAIRAEIDLARATAQAALLEENADQQPYETRRVHPGRAPSSDEVRAGWATIAGRLTEPEPRL